VGEPDRYYLAFVLLLIKQDQKYDRNFSFFLIKLAHRFVKRSYYVIDIKQWRRRLCKLNLLTFANNLRNFEDFTRK